MNAYETRSDFQHHFLSKPYIHLSEHAVMSCDVFFLAEGLNVISVLQSAGDYLNDQGNAQNSYEILLNRAIQIYELSEVETDTELRTDEFSVIARFLEPYWVFTMQYE
jgi:hypothetical protein